MRRVPRGVAAVTALGFVLMHVPVIVLAVFSFNASRYGVAWTGFTTHWYAELMARPDILASLRVSLVVGLVSTLVSTALGTLLAIGMERAGRRGAAARDALVALPIVTPEIVAGIGSLALFAALFIGGDSGPLHTAATTRVPIVGLYGPALPARSAPCEGKSGVSSSAARALRTASGVSPCFSTKPST